jgi:hypothetical protein
VLHSTECDDTGLVEPISPTALRFDPACQFLRDETVELEGDLPDRSLEDVDQWDVHAVESCQCFGLDTLAFDVFELPLGNDTLPSLVCLVLGHERDLATL